MGNFALGIDKWNISRNEPFQRAMAGLPPYTANQQKNFKANTGDFLGLLSTSTMAVPGVGDIAGLLADANMYATRPESRGLLNYGMTLAGALPLVPSAANAKTLANAATSAADVAYRGLHKAPSISGANTLHNLADIYGDDIYSRNALRFFGMGEEFRKADMESLAAINKARGNPDAVVTVYRAVPADENIQRINPGDWVALSKDYARKHGESALGGRYKIISQKAKASELATTGDALSEWGWHPAAK